MQGRGSWVVHLDGRPRIQRCARACAGYRYLGLFTYGCLSIPTGARGDLVAGAEPEGGHSYEAAAVENHGESCGDDSVIVHDEDTR
jgi:hypothetical protein